MLARAGAPLHHFLQVLRELALFGTCHAGQRDRVLVNVVTHGNPADERLQLGDFVSGQHGFNRELILRRGSLADRDFVRRARIG